MKNISNFIIEKLIIGKNLKKPNTYYEFNLKDKNIKVKLPFTINLPEINQSVEISKIDTNKDHNKGGSYWNFYNKYGKPVLSLIEIGIINLFIKIRGYNEYTKMKPLIRYLDNNEYYGEQTETVLDDPYNTIIKESNIDEKLIINKNLKLNNIFKFDDDRKVKLPFNIEVCGSSSEKIIITISKIEVKKTPKAYDNKIRYYFYDNQDKLIMAIPDYHVKALLFGNHVVIEKIKDLNILNKLNRLNDRVIIRFKDDKSKIIIKENINITNNEPKIFANIILLNPDEDKILILRRANYMKMWRGMWGFPGGHVDKKDKNPKEAAIRELKEETGITLSFNEERKLKEYDKIKHDDDNSICYYYITTLETNVDVKLSKEHAGYEWFNEKSEKKNHKWVPDVFQLIQKVL